MNSVTRNECNPIDYLQINLFSGKIPDIFSILDGLGHYDVVMGLCELLQVVLDCCGWFRLVVDGF